MMLHDFVEKYLILVSSNRMHGSSHPHLCCCSKRNNNFVSGLIVCVCTCIYVVDKVEQLITDKMINTRS